MRSTVEKSRTVQKCHGTVWPTGPKYPVPPRTVISLPLLVATLEPQNDDARTRDPRKRVVEEAPEKRNRHLQCTRREGRDQRPKIRLPQVSWRGDAGTRRERKKRGVKARVTT